MVRSHTDDVITAVSKNLKAEAPPVLRLTFKRGGLWRREFAKAHSRKARVEVRELVKREGNDEETEWPLLVRLRENLKNEEGVKEVKRVNCQAKPGKGASFLESLLSVFRVNFFKKKNDV